MTDEAAMIAAIKARPDDDTPRLVYADWLADHGREERAEFVRAQIELARGVKHNHKHREFGGPPEGCRACRLHRAACRWIESDAGGKAEYRGLFPDQGDLWYGGYQLLGHSIGIEFNRGFIEGVSLPLAAFVGGRCVVPPGRSGRCVSGTFQDVTGACGTCPYCDGTGRNPGLAADLFTAHPIARVVATDVSVRQRDGWGWCVSPPVGWPPIVDPRQFLGHESEKDALDAVSGWLVAYGRRLAREAVAA